MRSSKTGDDGEYEVTNLRGNMRSSKTGDGAGIVGINRRGVVFSVSGVLLNADLKYEVTLL